MPIDVGKEYMKWAKHRYIQQECSLVCAEGTHFNPEMSVEREYCGQLRVNAVLEMFQRIGFIRWNGDNEQREEKLREWQAGAEARNQNFRTERVQHGDLASDSIPGRSIDDGDHGVMKCLRHIGKAEGKSSSIGRYGTSCRL